MIDFKTDTEAFVWMYEQVDDPYIDNERFAYLEDKEATLEYQRQLERGCCGSFDANITINGAAAKIGCNYGH